MMPNTAKSPWAWRRVTGAAFGALVAGLVQLSGCGKAVRQPTPLPGALSRFVPSHSLFLDAADSVILDPQFLLQRDSASLLAIEKGVQDLWELPLDSRRRPRRLGSLRGRGRTRALGAAAHGERVGVIDLTGTISILDSGSAEPRVRVRLRVPRGTRMVALMASTDSSWLVAEQRAHTAADGATRDSVFVARVFPNGSQRTEWAFERAGPSRPSAFLSDFVGASAYGDTVIVTAADPPRIMHWIAGGKARVRQVVLTGVPKRTMTDTDLEELRVATLHIRNPLAQRAQLKGFYPQIVAARPYGNGWFVVGGAGRGRFALDYFCRSDYREALLDAPGIARIVLLASAVVVVRDDLDHGRMIVERFPYPAFHRDCR